MSIRRTRRKTLLCVGLSIGFVLSSVSAAAGKPSQADSALAKASVLALADFPSGWRSQSSSSKEADRIRAQTPQCKGYEKSRKQVRQRNGHADSPEFAQGDMYADSTVVVFADEQAATKAGALLGGSAFKSCASTSGKKIIESRLQQKNVHYDDVHVDVGDLSADQAGDATTAQQEVVTISQGSITSKIYIDLEVIRVGRALALLGFQSASTPFPDLKASLIDAVVTRLRQGLGSGTASPSANASRPFGAVAIVPGGRVTVYSYEQPATGINQYVKPQTPAAEFSAVDAEVCATGTAGLGANSYDFRLQFSDNSQRQPSYGKGPDEIRDWLSRASTQFDYTRTLTGFEAIDDNSWLVTNHLEGNFPGGVVDLR